MHVLAEHVHGGAVLSTAGTESYLFDSKLPFGAKASPTIFHLLSHRAEVAVTLLLHLTSALDGGKLSGGVGQLIDTLRCCSVKVGSWVG